MSSASQMAYLTIRDMIANGLLRAGDPLVAEDLAAVCGLSRTPVREAILRLQAEMFAVRLDNKRTVVRVWSADEIDDFVALRLLLMGYAASRAAARVTEAELTVLRAINLRMGDLAHGPAEGAFQALSAEFYDALVTIAASERLRQLSRHVLNPGPLLQALGRFAKQGNADVVSDHGEVIQALQAHDSKWAEATMVLHLRKTYRARDFVQSQQSVAH